MSKSVELSPSTRQEYDSLLKDRIQVQKLARGVLYIFMIKNEKYVDQAGKLLVEIIKLPAYSVGASDQGLPVEIGFIDDDAQPVFQLAGIVKSDQIVLSPRCLRKVDDGSTLKEGYLLANESEKEIAMQEYELAWSGNSMSRLSL